MLKLTPETAKIFILLSETTQTELYKKAFEKARLSYRILDFSFNEALLVTQKPFAVLVDLDLLETAPALKQRVLMAIRKQESENTDFPWIAISSRLETGHVQAYLQSGFSEVLSKLDSADHLMESVIQSRRRKVFLCQLKLSHRVHDALEG